MDLEELAGLEALELRLGLIRGEIESLKASGEIAAPGTWIQKYKVPKKKAGKSYYYYRLMELSDKKSRSGSIQGKLKLYLGKEKSELYLKHKAAIERRNQLKVLQRRYDKLNVFYQKALSLKGASSIADDRGGDEVERKLVDKAVQAESREWQEELVKTLKGLESNTAQIYQVLKAIGEKLSIEIPSQNQKEYSTLNREDPKFEI